MICRNCGAYFIRFPCPSCKLTEQEDREIRLSHEKEVRVEIHEEPLLKPSELKGNSAVTKLKEVEEIPENLVKPSEMSADKLVSAEDFLEDGEEKLVRPSQLRGGSSIGQNQPKKETPKVVITQARQNLTPIRETPTSSVLKKGELAKPVRREGETDEEYRNRVRDTLMEVMSLLEKLVED